MSTLAIAPLQSNFHTPHIIHSALISLLISLHVITQFESSPTQIYRTHYLLLSPVISISPTFLSATPLSYIWPIHYYSNRLPLLRLHHLSPIPYFCAIAPRFTRKYDTNHIDFRIILIPLIYNIDSIPTFCHLCHFNNFMFSSHRLPFHSNFLPSNNLKDTKVCLNLSKPKPSNSFVI